MNKVVRLCIYELDTPSHVLTNPIMEQRVSVVTRPEFPDARSRQEHYRALAANPVNTAAFSLTRVLGVPLETAHILSRFEEVILSELPERVSLLERSTPRIMLVLFLSHTRHVAMQALEGMMSFHRDDPVLSDTVRSLSRFLRVVNVEYARGALVSIRDDVDDDEDEGEGEVADEEEEEEERNLAQVEHRFPWARIGDMMLNLGKLLGEELLFLAAAQTLRETSQNAVAELLDRLYALAGLCLYTISVSNASQAAVSRHMDSIRAAWRPSYPARKAKNRPLSQFHPENIASLTPSLTILFLLRQRLAKNLTYLRNLKTTRRTRSGSILARGATVWPELVAQGFPEGLLDTMQSPMAVAHDLLTEGMQEAMQAIESVMRRNADISWVPEPLAGIRVDRGRGPETRLIQRDRVNPVSSAIASSAAVARAVSRLIDETRAVVSVLGQSVVRRDHLRFHVHVSGRALDILFRALPPFPGNAELSVAPTELSIMRMRFFGRTMRIAKAAMMNSLTIEWILRCLNRLSAHGVSEDDARAAVITLIRSTDFPRSRFLKHRSWGVAERFVRSGVIRPAPASDPTHVWTPEDGHVVVGRHVIWTYSPRVGSDMSARDVSLLRTKIRVMACMRYNRDPQAAAQLGLDQASHRSLALGAARLFSVYRTRSLLIKEEDEDDDVVDPIVVQEVHTKRMDIGPAASFSGVPADLSLWYYAILGSDLVFQQDLSEQWNPDRADESEARQRAKLLRGGNDTLIGTVIGPKANVRLSDDGFLRSLFGKGAPNPVVELLGSENDPAARNVLRFRILQAYLYHNYLKSDEFDLEQFEELFVSQPDEEEVVDEEGEPMGPLAVLHGELGEHVLDVVSLWPSIRGPEIQRIVMTIIASYETLIRKYESDIPLNGDILRTYKETLDNLERVVPMDERDENAETAVADQKKMVDELRRKIAAEKILVQRLDLAIERLQVAQRLAGIFVETDAELRAREKETKLVKKEKFTKALFARLRAYFESIPDASMQVEFVRDYLVGLALFGGTSMHGKVREVLAVRADELSVELLPTHTPLRNLENQRRHIEEIRLQLADATEKLSSFDTKNPGVGGEDTPLAKKRASLSKRVSELSEKLETLEQGLRKVAENRRSRGSGSGPVREEQPEEEGGVSVADYAKKYMIPYTTKADDLEGPATPAKLTFRQGVPSTAAKSEFKKEIWMIESLDSELEQEEAVTDLFERIVAVLLDEADKHEHLPQIAEVIRKKISSAVAAHMFARDEGDAVRNLKASFDAFGERWEATARDVRNKEDLMTEEKNSAVMAIFGKIVVEFAHGNAESDSLSIIDRYSDAIRDGEDKVGPLNSFLEEFVPSLHANYDAYMSLSHKFRDYLWNSVIAHVVEKVPKVTPNQQKMIKDGIYSDTIGGRAALKTSAAKAVRRAFGQRNLDKDAAATSIFDGLAAGGIVDGIPAAAGEVYDRHKATWDAGPADKAEAVVSFVEEFVALLVGSLERVPKNRRLLRETIWGVAKGRLEQGLKRALRWVDKEDEIPLFQQLIGGNDEFRRLKDKIREDEDKAHAELAAQKTAEYEGKKLVAEKKYTERVDRARERYKKNNPDDPDADGFSPAPFNYRPLVLPEKKVKAFSKYASMKTLIHKLLSGLYLPVNAYHPWEEYTTTHKKDQVMIYRLLVWMRDQEWASSGLQHNIEMRSLPDRPLSRPEFAFAANSEHVTYSYVWLRYYIDNIVEALSGILPVDEDDDSIEGARLRLAREDLVAIQTFADEQIAVDQPRDNDTWKFNRWSEVSRAIRNRIDESENIVPVLAKYAVSGLPLSLFPARGSADEVPFLEDRWTFSTNVRSLRTYCLLDAEIEERDVPKSVAWSENKWVVEAKSMRSELDETRRKNGSDLVESWGPPSMREIVAPDRLRVGEGSLAAIADQAAAQISSYLEVLNDGSEDWGKVLGIGPSPDDPEPVAVISAQAAPEETALDEAENDAGVVGSMVPDEDEFEQEDLSIRLGSQKGDTLSDQSQELVIGVSREDSARSLEEAAAVPADDPPTAVVHMVTEEHNAELVEEKRRAEEAAREALLIDAEREAQKAFEDEQRQKRLAEERDEERIAMQEKIVEEAKKRPPKRRRKKRKPKRFLRLTELDEMEKQRGRELEEMEKQRERELEEMEKRLEEEREALEKKKRERELEEMEMQRAIEERNALDREMARSREAALRAPKTVIELLDDDLSDLEDEFEDKQREVIEDAHDALPDVREVVRTVRVKELARRARVGPDAPQLRAVEASIPVARMADPSVPEGTAVLPMPGSGPVVNAPARGRRPRVQPAVAAAPPLLPAVPPGEIYDPLRNLLEKLDRVEAESQGRGAEWMRPRVRLAVNEFLSSPSAGRLLHEEVLMAKRALARGEKLTAREIDTLHYFEADQPGWKHQLSVPGSVPGSHDELIGADLVDVHKGGDYWEPAVVRAVSDDGLQLKVHFLPDMGKGTWVSRGKVRGALDVGTKWDIHAVGHPGKDGRKEDALVVRELVREHLEPVTRTTDAGHVEFLRSKRGYKRFNSRREGRGISFRGSVIDVMESASAMKKGLFKVLVRNTGIGKTARRTLQKNESVLVTSGGRVARTMRLVTTTRVVAGADVHLPTVRGDLPVVPRLTRPPSLPARVIGEEQRRERAERRLQGLLERLAEYRWRHSIAPRDVPLHAVVPTLDAWDTAADAWDVLMQRTETIPARGLDAQVVDRETSRPRWANLANLRLYDRSTGFVSVLQSYNAITGVAQVQRKFVLSKIGPHPHDAESASRKLDSVGPREWGLFYKEGRRITSTPIDDPSLSRRVAVVTTHRHLRRVETTYERDRRPEELVYDLVVGRIREEFRGDPTIMWHEGSFLTEEEFLGEEYNVADLQVDDHEILVRNSAGEVLKYDLGNVFLYEPSDGTISRFSLEKPGDVVHVVSNKVGKIAKMASYNPVVGEELVSRMGKRSVRSIGLFTGVKTTVPIRDVIASIPTRDPFVMKKVRTYRELADGGKVLVRFLSDGFEMAVSRDELKGPTKHEKRRRRLMTEDPLPEEEEEEEGEVVVQPFPPLEDVVRRQDDLLEQERMEDARRVSRARVRGRAMRTRVRQRRERRSERRTREAVSDVAPPLPFVSPPPAPPVVVVEPDPAPPQRTFVQSLQSVLSDPLSAGAVGDATEQVYTQWDDMFAAANDRGKYEVVRAAAAVETGDAGASAFMQGIRRTEPGWEFDPAHEPESNQPFMRSVTDYVPGMHVHVHLGTLGNTPDWYQSDAVHAIPLWWPAKIETANDDGTFTVKVPNGPALVDGPESYDRDFSGSPDSVVSLLEGVKRTHLRRAMWHRSVAGATPEGLEMDDELRDLNGRFRFARKNLVAESAKPQRYDLANRNAAENYFWIFAHTYVKENEPGLLVDTSTYEYKTDDSVSVLVFSEAAASYQIVPATVSRSEWLPGPAVWVKLANEREEREVPRTVVLPMDVRTSNFPWDRQWQASDPVQFSDRDLFLRVYGITMNEDDKRYDNNYCFYTSLARALNRMLHEEAREEAVVFEYLWLFWIACYLTWKRAVSTAGKRLQSERLIQIIKRYRHPVTRTAGKRREGAKYVMAVDPMQDVLTKKMGLAVTYFTQWTDMAGAARLAQCLPHDAPLGDGDATRYARSESLPDTAGEPLRVFLFHERITRERGQCGGHYLSVSEGMGSTPEWEETKRDWNEMGVKVNDLLRQYRKLRRKAKAWLMSEAFVPPKDDPWMSPDFPPRWEIAPVSQWLKTERGMQRRHWIKATEHIEDILAVQDRVRRGRLNLGVKIQEEEEEGEESWRLFRDYAEEKGDRGGPPARGFVHVWYRPFKTVKRGSSVKNERRAMSKEEIARAQKWYYETQHRKHRIGMKDEDAPDVGSYMIGGKILQGYIQRYQKRGDFVTRDKANTLIMVSRLDGDVVTPREKEILMIKASLDAIEPEDLAFETLINEAPIKMVWSPNMWTEYDGLTQLGYVTSPRQTANDLADVRKEIILKSYYASRSPIGLSLAGGARSFRNETPDKAAEMIFDSISKQRAQAIVLRAFQKVGNKGVATIDGLPVKFSDRFAEIDRLTQVFTAEWAKDYGVAVELARKQRKRIVNLRKKKTNERRMARKKVNLLLPKTKPNLFLIPKTGRRRNK